VGSQEGGEMVLKGGIQQFLSFDVSYFDKILIKNL
jgi:hypothetical protein